MPAWLTQTTANYLNNIRLYKDVLTVSMSLEIDVSD